MSSTKAFAPANISCIFKIHKHNNPRWAGSIGLGFTLNEGVVVEIKKSNKNQNEIYFNDDLIDFPTVNYILNNISKEKFEVKITSKLPLGCGFGMSGASALATSYSLSKLLNLNKTKKELVILSHTAEVENQTGLGDVVNQYYGGFCLKLKPSSHFVVEKLPLTNNKIYCKFYNKIETKSIISNQDLLNKINTSAELSLKKINKNNDLKEIIKISKEFSINSGLLKNEDVINTIKKIEKNNGSASMIMLGNAVFSDTKFPDSEEFIISDQGAKLL
tara:strand:+ start:10504 stop:11328 length:825 start_codon:yes stop_codon:yes gene_type:complete